MVPEKGKINIRQLSWLITGFCFGSNVLLPTGTAAAHDSWLAILSGTGLGILFGLIYTVLSIWFPEQNLVEIFETVYGRLLGKIIFISLLWFFFHSGSLVLDVFSHFFTTVVMPETPGPVFLIGISLACLMVARKGIEVLARCGEILVPVTIGVFILNTIMLLPEFNWNNVRPLFEAPWSDFLAATYQVAVFPFGEIVVFGMIFQNLNHKSKIFSSVIPGLVIAGLTLMMASFRNISVLGASIELYNYPSFQAFQLINIGQVITRLEIIVAINAITMGFLKTSVLLYGTSLGAARVLGLRSNNVLVIPLSLLMIIFAIINFNNVTETSQFFHQRWLFYAAPFELGIPILTLAVAWVRKATGNLPGINGGESV